MPPATDAPAITRSAAIARRCRTCSSTCSSMRTARRRGRSCSTSMPPLARPPGRPVLPRLLRLLLLFAALCVLRPSAVGGKTAALEHRRRGRRQGRDGAPRRPHPPALAQGTDPASRRLRLRPRGADGLVRGLARRLPLRPGPQQRLLDEIAIDLAWAEAEHQETGKPARRFKDFFYATRDSWNRRRRVIGKAEHLAKGANPRFIVASRKRKPTDAQTLYEQVYCARGEMENRIKECQLDLWADRTSTATMAANQLRLWFSSFAYVLLEALRRIGLPHTEL